MIRFSSQNILECSTIEEKKVSGSAQTINRFHEHEGKLEAIVKSYKIVNFVQK